MDPSTPGMQTSEGKFTLAAQIVGFLLTTYGALLTKAAEAHPQNIWLAAGVTLMGVLMMVATHYGYTKGRAMVKSAAIQAGIDAVGPLSEALLEAALQKYLAKKADAAAPAPVASSAAALTAAAPAPAAQPAQPSP